MMKGDFTGAQKMAHRHFMLDLETLGTNPNDAIIAIGIAPMDLDGRTLGDGLYIKVSADSCQEAGMNINASTVMWWMQQSEAAREEFKDNHAHASIAQALLSVHDFITDQSSGVPKEDIHVWGNGAIMDNALLLSAYKTMGIEPPWTYKGDMCYRTVRALTPKIEAIEPEIAHHALSDAEAQAKTLFLKLDALGL